VVGGGGGGGGGGGHHALATVVGAALRADSDYGCCIHATGRLGVALGAVVDARAVPLGGVGDGVAVANQRAAVAVPRATSRVVAARHIRDQHR